MKKVSFRFYAVLAAVVLAAATAFFIHRANSGINALSWNVRKAIADRLCKDVSALTTNNLAVMVALMLRDEFPRPIFTLPAALARFQRFVPERKNIITDADLAHLDMLPALQELQLWSPRVTDAGLVHLEKLTALRVLALSGTQVTDAGLVHLEKLTALKYLYLGATQVTDDGLVHLEKLAKLGRLDLSGTQVTDAGLVHLEKLIALRNLGLSGTRVTDVGLVHLEKLTKLEYLYLRRTLVTDAGIAKLKKALPGCGCLISRQMNL